MDDHAGKRLRGCQCCKSNWTFYSNAGDMGDHLKSSQKETYSALFKKKKKFFVVDHMSSMTCFGQNITGSVVVENFSGPLVFSGE